MRDGTALATRHRQRPASGGRSRLGASVACSGVCLTVVEKGRAGSRSRSRPRPCAPRSAPGARARRSTSTLAQARRRARRPPRLRPCRRRRDIAAIRAGGRAAGASIRGARRWPPRRGQGLGRARRRLAHRERGRGDRFGVHIIPHTLELTTLEDRQRGRPGQPGNRHAGALRCAPTGVRSASHERRHHSPRGPGGRGRPLARSTRSSRTPAHGRMFILVDDEDRENEGDLVIPAQMRDARRHQLHGQARPRPDLPGADPRAGRAARPAADGAATTARAHQTAFTVSIEAREGVTTGISAADRARTIAVAIDPSQGAAATSSRPATSSRWWRATAACWCAPAIPKPAVDIARLAGLDPGRRDLRDHERRRHDGAPAATWSLRPAPRPEDRHHRRPDRLSPAPRPHRRARRCETDVREPLRRDVQALCLHQHGRARPSMSRWSRATSHAGSRCWCACTR